MHVAHGKVFFIKCKASVCAIKCDTPCVYNFTGICLIIYKLVSLPNTLYKHILQKNVVALPRALLDLHRLSIYILLPYLHAKYDHIYF